MRTTTSLGAAVERSRSNLDEIVRATVPCVQSAITQLCDLDETVTVDWFGSTTMADAWGTDSAHHELVWRLTLTTELDDQTNSGRSELEASPCWPPQESTTDFAHYLRNPPNIRVNGVATP